MNETSVPAHTAGPATKQSQPIQTGRQMAPGKARPAGLLTRGGPVFILAAALLWSLAGLLIKYIPWHPMAIAGGRSFLAAFVFIAFYRRRLLRWPGRVTVLSGLALALTQIGFVIANKLTTAANAIMLQYVSPFFVVVLGALLYHYRPTRREVTALVIASSGIILFFLDDLSPGNMAGNLLALGTAVTFAMVFLFNHRPECDTPVALFIGQAVTFLSGLPFLLTTRDFSWPPLLSMLILGIFQLGLAYFCFGIGIRTTPPLAASLLAMVEPIINPVWVFLAVHEVPGWPALTGAAIVLAAVLYLNLRNLKLARTSSPDQ